MLFVQIIVIVLVLFFFFDNSGIFIVRDFMVSRDMEKKAKLNKALLLIL